MIPSLPWYSSILFIVLFVGFIGYTLVEMLVVWAQKKKLRKLPSPKWCSSCVVFGPKPHICYDAKCPCIFPEMHRNNPHA